MLTGTRDTFIDVFGYKFDAVSQGSEARRSAGEAALQNQPQDREACHQGGQEGSPMMDKVGKIFVVKGSLRRCLVCDVLFF